MSATDNVLFNRDEINSGIDSMIALSKALIESLNDSIDTPRPEIFTEDDIRFDEALIEELRESVRRQKDFIRRLNTRRIELLAEADLIVVPR